MKYPFFKPGDTVRVIDSTLSPSPGTRQLAKDKVLVTIRERRRDRYEYNGLPVYIVTHGQTGYWYFFATDLEKVDV